MSVDAVLAALRGRLPSLTGAEAAVARAILRDPHASAKASIGDLAASADVSTASVVRTARALGYTGFRDFRTALIADVSSGRNPVMRDVEPGDSAIEVARKVFIADLNAIASTLELLDEAAFEHAVSLLAGAERIEAYGIGSSAPVAVDAYYRLLRLGLRVAVVTDSHMQAVSASLLTPADVALVFSHTGRTSETLTTARIARDAGSKIVAVTSFLDSPLAGHVDALLVVATAESAYRVEAMASRIAHLSIVDALYVALANRMADSASKVLEQSSQIIEEKRIPPRNHD
jgi:DNA-binding MurR/RpiR family transcriptional regulator